MIKLLALFWHLLAVTVQARTFFAARGHCDLTASPLVTLSWDEEKNGYEEEESSPESQRRRQQQQLLRQEEDQQEHRMVALTEQEYPHNATIQMRKCPCVPERWNISYYCPSQKQYCYLPFGSRVPTCVNEPSRNAFVKTIWIPTIICFSLLMLWLTFSVMGHMALDCVVAHAFRCCWWVGDGYNGWLADRILRLHPIRAERMIRTAYQRRQQTLEERYEEVLAAQQGGPRRRGRGGQQQPQEVEALPVARPISIEEELQRASYNSNNSSGTPTITEHSISLKTRKYRRQPQPRTGPRERTPSKLDAMLMFMGDNNDPVDDELLDCGATCTICFAPLLDGDRVAVMEHCSHVFHVHCLKTWLRRRNVCPLCLQPAAPLQSRQVPPPPPPPPTAVMMESVAPEPPATSTLEDHDGPQQQDDDDEEVGHVAPPPPFATTEDANAYEPPNASTEDNNIIVDETAAEDT